jgi:hypothetical protein
MAARAAYCNDARAVIISTGNPEGFKVFGFSVNMDYHIRGNVPGRLEARSFTGKDNIFANKTGMPSGEEFFISTALTISF